MSLLLDALKKAAEQKLQKEASGETQAEIGYEFGVEANSLTETSLDLPIGDEAADRTMLDIDDAEASLGGDKTDYLKEDDTQLGQDDWRLEDATAFDLTGSAEPTDYSILNKANFDRPADDTIADDTALGSNTDTGGLQREWQALSYETYDPADGETYFPSAESPAQTVSLTKNIQNKQAAFQSSPSQAAYMFSNKHLESDKRGRKLLLYGVLFSGVLTLGGLYGYEYLQKVTDDSASYRPIRPSRPMQLESGLSSQLDTLSGYEDEALVDSTLLVEQEDYAGLLEEERPDKSEARAVESSDEDQRREAFDDEKTQKPKFMSNRVVSTKERRAVNSGSAIQISKQQSVPPLQEVLLQAYDAYQTGNTAQAQILYERVLQRDANNRDGLLGLAALELQRARFEQAEEYYNQVLRIDPRDSYAIAGLDAVKSGQVGAKALNESQLKRLLQQQPEAHELHFSLGNLYARERNWSFAQKSFFSAHGLDKANPDYLFNLAVSLDHLGQIKTAKQFYAQALMAAELQAAHFDVTAANQRLQTLSALEAE